MKQPNALAFVALYGWPLVVLAAYALRRSTARLSRTTAWMLLLPVMFLPALLRLPFAALDKHRIAFLSIAFALALFHPTEIKVKDRWGRFPVYVLLLFIAGAAQTYRTNTDALSFGILRLPGLGPRDVAWMIYEFSVDMVLPFAIGQRVFRTERAVRDLLEVLSTCTLIYVPLCLIEMRLSPQFSNWIYGYFPHSFAQTTRGTGYRPVVFMNHGLSVGMFLFSGVCAALTLRTAHPTSATHYGRRAAALFAVLLLARNLASTLYSSYAMAARSWIKPRTQARALLAITLLVIIYPALRMTSRAPTSGLGTLFQTYDKERSASLMYRFHEEERLLARALERPLFGWGGWGRGRIYHSWGEPGDAWAGYQDVSITDSSWIIWFATFGIAGLAASMALLLLPLVRFFRNHTRMHEGPLTLAGGLAMIIALFAVDLLINSQSDFLPLTYSGALFALSRQRT